MMYIYTTFIGLSMNWSAWTFSNIYLAFYLTFGYIIIKQYTLLFFPTHKHNLSLHTKSLILSQSH